MITHNQITTKILTIAGLILTSLIQLQAASSSSSDHSLDRCSPASIEAITLLFDPDATLPMDQADREAISQMITNIKSDLTSTIEAGINEVREQIIRQGHTDAATSMRELIHPIVGIRTVIDEDINQTRIQAAHESYEAVAPEIHARHERIQERTRTARLLMRARDLQTAGWIRHNNGMDNPDNPAEIIGFRRAIEAERRAIAAINNSAIQANIESTERNLDFYYRFAHNLDLPSERIGENRILVAPNLESELISLIVNSNPRI